MIPDWVSVHRWTHSSHYTLEPAKGICNKRFSGEVYGSGAVWSNVSMHFSDCFFIKAFYFHISQEVQQFLLLILVQHLIVCWNLKNYKCNTTKVIHVIINWLWRLILVIDLTSCLFVTCNFFSSFTCNMLFISNGLLVLSISLWMCKFSALVFLGNEG